MNRRFSFSLFGVALALAACTPRFQTVDAKWGTFADEQARIEGSGLCNWSHAKADPQSLKKYDFGCHGGPWGMVSLFMDAQPSDPAEVGKMRLLWKEWKPGEHTVDERPQAEMFIDFIARHYAPDMAEVVRDTFFGRLNRSFETTNLTFDYEHRTLDQYWLHRMEIGRRKAIELAD